MNATTANLIGKTVGIAMDNGIAAAEILSAYEATDHEIIISARLAYDYSVVSNVRLCDVYPRTRSTM